MDLLKGAVGLLAKKANLEIIKQGQKDMMRKLENKIFSHFADFQRRLAQPSGQDLEAAEDKIPTNIAPQRLNETMPPQMK